jgi:hypothetical protein
MDGTSSKPDGVSKMIEEHFRIITTKSVPEAQQIREAFRKKRILENRISKMIKDYEFETGLAIDMIRYQRDITLPIKGPKYTALSIIITAEESNDD